MWDVAVQMGKMGLRTIADGFSGWRRGEGSSLRKMAIGVSAIALSVFYSASMAGATQMSLAEFGGRHVLPPELCKGWKCFPTPDSLWYCQAVVPWDAETGKNGGHFYSFLNAVYANFVEHRCGVPSQGIEVRILENHSRGNVLLTMLGGCHAPKFLPSHPCQGDAFSREL